MGRPYRSFVNSRSKEHENRADWFSAVEGIVAEVDDATHAIKVVIPAIDENLIHDEWVDALMPWVGPDGYGPVNLPAIGSEVILFSRLNEGHSLFYLSRYNENFRPPAEFADGSRGLKVDTPYRLLCDLLIQILSQTQVLVRGEQRADVQAGQAIDADAPDIRLMSGGAVSVHGQGDKVGFLGAGPAARQALPGPAINSATCIELTNAIRALLITFGLAQ
ncbi:MAG TPA: hypothetical protein VIP46_22515 [Pyrinomonadaceae bacterium]